MLVILLITSYIGRAKHLYSYANYAVNIALHNIGKFESVILPLVIMKIIVQENILCM